MRTTLLASIAALLACASASAAGDVHTYNFVNGPKQVADSRVKVTHYEAPQHADLQTRAATRADEEEPETAVVKFRIINDDPNLILQYAIPISHNGERTRSIRSEQFTEEEDGTISYPIAVGMTDFYFNFAKIIPLNDEGYRTADGTYRFLVEDVDVNENTPVIEIRPAECRRIGFDIKFPDGSEIIPDLVKIAENEQGFEIVKPGTLSFSDCNIYVYHDKAGSAGTEWRDGLLQNFEEAADVNAFNFHTIFVNPASNRWHFYTSVLYMDQDMQKVVVANFDITPDMTEDVKITPNDLTYIPWNFKKSAALAHDPVENEFHSAINVDVDSPSGSGPSGGFGVQWITKDPDIWMYSQAPDDWQLVTSVFLKEVDKTEESEWGDLIFIGTCAVQAAVESGEVRYIQNQMSSGSARLMSKPMPDAVATGSYPEFYTGHPRFSFFDKDFSPVWGTTTPILKVVSDSYIDERNNGAFTTTITAEALGQYGEYYQGFRNCNLLCYDVKYNGEYVREGVQGYINDFAREWVREGHDRGVMEYVLRARDKWVDNFNCKNETYVYEDQTKDDCAAPTLTQLMCRDANDKISNRFDKPADGVVEFTAGDFVSKESFHKEYGWRYNWFEDTRDLDVAVEYSPMGLGVWAPLDYSVVDDYYTHSFGTFYRASLDAIDVESANRWYDLRITLTDPSGNKQQQVISPVFEISNVSSNVPVLGAENDTPVYYNLQGQRVANPEPGQILIVRYGSTAKKIRF